MQSFGVGYQLKHEGVGQGVTRQGVSPECVSVISAQSVTGQFCRVLINDEPVIVPREYLKVDPSGRLSCSISGLEFPIVSYEEVALEQGPRSSEPDSLSSSNLSLVVPSPESSSGLSLQDDKLYTVLAEGTKYRVPGRDIIRAGDDSEGFLLEINGELLEVSDIEEDDTDVEESIYSEIAAGKTSPLLNPSLNYDVIFNGKCLTLPGDMFHPTDVYGKYLVSMEGEAGLVENPLPSSQFLNCYPHTGMFPSQNTFLSTNFPNNSSPTVQPSSSKLAMQAPHSFITHREIDKQNSPTSLSATHFKQEGKLSASSSPIRPASKQEIVEEYITKLDHIITSTKPHKATFVSPAAFLTQVIPIVKHESKATSGNNKHVNFSTVSSSESSSPEDGLARVSQLPGIDMLGHKAITIEQMHLEAFVPHPVKEDQLGNQPDLKNVPEVEQSILPGIASLNERVRTEIEVAAALQQHILEQELQDSSCCSSENEIVEKFNKLSNLPGLEVFSALAVKNALEINLSNSGCEGEVTDSDLFDSISLKFRSGEGRYRNNTGSSANTLQQIDEMMSMNSSLGENGCNPGVRGSPSSQIVSAEEPVVDFFRVLIEGSWFTAKESELSSKDGETHMTMIDKTKKKAERVVRVPGVGSPTSLVYLCDNKTYSISHQGSVFTVAGSDIKTSPLGGFLVPIEGKMVHIKRDRITEVIEPPKQFASLKSMVAIQLSGVWKIIPSEKLAPSAKKVGNYYVKRNGKVIVISPQEVYPMLKKCDLPLGSNSVPEKYVTKLEGRLVKVPMSLMSVLKAQDDKILISYRNKKHVMKLTELQPFIRKNSSPIGKVGKTALLDEQLSLTNTSTFSGSEYKDNLYCINLGSRVVNVPGRFIKPHKSKQGFCKVKYRSKIFRVRAEKVKLARQNVPGSNNKDVLLSVSSKSPQRYSGSTETSPIGTNVVVHNTKDRAQSLPLKPKTQVRFPNFNELLKAVPSENHPALQNSLGNLKTGGTKKVKLSLKLDQGCNPKMETQPRVSNSPPKSFTDINRTKKKKQIPIKLDVIPGNKLRLKKNDGPLQEKLFPHSNRGKASKTISPIPEESAMKNFEITNIRSSPVPEEGSNLVHFEITNVRSSPVLRTDDNPPRDLTTTRRSPSPVEKKTCVVRPHQSRECVNRVYIGCNTATKGQEGRTGSLSTSPPGPSLHSPTIQTIPTHSPRPTYSTPPLIQTHTQIQPTFRPKSAPNQRSILRDPNESGPGDICIDLNNAGRLSMFNVTGSVSLRKRRALSDKVGIIGTNLCSKNL